MNLADAEKNFGVLVNRVYAEGISVDLERDDKVIARLTPADPSSPLTVGGLLAFLRNLPPLGEDARAIARQNPCLFGLNFSSCVASSGFFHLPKRKTPENKPFNVRLPWSGIRSDPNRADDPEYIVRLVGQVVRVSVETVKIVKGLPEFA